MVVPLALPVGQEYAAESHGPAFSLRVAAARVTRWSGGQAVRSPSRTRSTSAPVTVQAECFVIGGR